MAEIDKKQYEPQTSILMSFEMSVDDKPCVIEGELGKNFSLKLSEAAKLGSPISFGYWLRNDFKVDCGLLAPITKAGGGDLYKTSAEYKAAVAENPNTVHAAVVEHLKLKDVPAWLQSTLATAMMGELVITDLFIENRADADGKEIKKRKFGLKLQFPRPLPLMESVTLKSCGFVIKSAPPIDDKFEGETKVLTAQPAVATGLIAFSKAPAADDWIKIGGATWTFAAQQGERQTAAGGGVMDDILKRLVVELNESQDAQIKLCTYSLAPGKGDTDREIWVSAAQPGPAGNDIVLAASAAKIGAEKTQSTGTLAGGR
ncbi:MAG: hypothetical protein HY985_13790 [Magnetospirillum sp.]|nr:hypothetical protein [Magnetospirillum sp.]